MLSGYLRCGWLPIFALLVLFRVGVVVDAQCSGSQKLQLQRSGTVSEIGNTAKPFDPALLDQTGLYETNARCADGTPIAYYFDIARGTAKDENPNTILWFGESAICSGSTCDELCSETNRVEVATSGVCKGISVDIKSFTQDDLENETVAQCIYARAVCGSSWWSEFRTLVTRTLLCFQDPLYGKYHRAFLPTCTLDWWLGNETIGDRHRGSQALNMLIHDMTFRFNLSYSSQILIGGTNGAAIGILNQADYIEELISNIHPFVETMFPKKLSPVSRTILALVDSAWTASVQSFSPPNKIPIPLYPEISELTDESKDWIANAKLNQLCVDSLGPNSDSIKWQCLMLPFLIPQVENRRVLIMQSSYDILQLKEKDLLNDTYVDTFDSLTAYGEVVDGYLETLAFQIRDNFNKIILMGEDRKHFFFLASCSQHGFVVPTFFHSLDALQYLVKDFAEITISRSYEAWDTIRVGDWTPKTAVDMFLKSNGESLFASEDTPKLAQDDCGTFQCNPTCLSALNSPGLAQMFSVCMQTIVIMYGGGLLVALFLIFFAYFCQILIFRRRTNKFWHDSDVASLTEDLTSDQRYREAHRKLIDESMNSEYKRVHVMVKNLSYWAPAKTRKSKPTQILRNVSISFAPGKVHGIMGPSGSGKTTLMDILSLNRGFGRMSGTYFINGLPLNSSECAFLNEWIRHNSSYVPQADVFFPTLTVREHLTHAAWLLMPQFQSTESKLQRISLLMSLFELDSCANTICGDGGVSIQGGLSGGQRRRLSVATHLLRKSAMLFLDEPTSGLDSTNALLLCRSLSALAEQAGVNIVMSLHQPRIEIFEFLHTISFLVSGRLMYCGSSKGAAEFFQVTDSINFANDIIDKVQSLNEQEIELLGEHFVHSDFGDALINDMNSERVTPTPSLLRKLKQLLVELSIAEGRWSWHQSSSASMLVWVHMSRTISRGGFAVLYTSLMALFVGALIGLIFLGAGSYQMRLSLAYLSVTTMTILQGTFLGSRYYAEKVMYDHERNAGTFSNWRSFMISQLIRDCVTSVIEGLSFSIPLYWIGGLNPDLTRFGFFTLIITLTSFTILSQNVFIEVDRSNIRVSSILEIGLIGVGALFSGFIVRLEDLPIYLSWVPYILVSYWSLAATLLNDLSDFSLPCTRLEIECVLQTGNAALREFGYSFVDKYFAVLILIVLILGFRTLIILDFYFRNVRKKGAQLKSVDSEDNETGSVHSFNSPMQPLSNTTIGKMLAEAEKRLKLDCEEFSDGKKLDDLSSNVSTTDDSAFESSSTGDKLPEIDAQKLASANRHDRPSNDDIYSWTRFKTFALDREILVLFFVLDFFSSAHICIPFGMSSGEDVKLVLMILASVVYIAQFVYQLCALIPKSRFASYTCAWAGAYDLPRAVLLGVDLALAIQIGGSASTFSVQLVLQAFLRLVRLFNVYLYWLKLDRYHFVRAKAFSSDMVSEKPLLVATYASNDDGSMPGNEEEADTDQGHVVDKEQPHANTCSRPPSTRSNVNRRSDAKPPPVPVLRKVDSQTDSKPVPVQRKFESQFDTKPVLAPVQRKVESQVDTKHSSVPVQRNVKSQADTKPPPVPVQRKVESQADTKPPPVPVQRKVESQADTKPPPVPVQRKVESQADTKPPPVRVQRKVESQADTKPPPVPVQRKVESQADTKPVLEPIKERKSRKSKSKSTKLSKKKSSSATDGERRNISQQNSNASQVPSERAISFKAAASIVKTQSESRNDSAGNIVAQLDDSWKKVGPGTYYNSNTGQVITVDE